MPKAANKRQLKTKGITVAILEDNATMVKGMKAELDKPDISICSIANHVDQFLKQLESCQPRIAIVDLRICQDFEAGFGVIVRAKELSPATQYIVHTAYDMIENFHSGINLGIKAFVSKNIYEKPLDEVVRLVFNGGTYYGELLPQYLKKLKENAVPLSFQSEEMPIKGDLSKTELEILELLDQEKSIEEIARERVVSKNTVKAQTRSIRGKLRVKTTHEAVRLYRLRRHDL